MRGLSTVSVHHLARNLYQLIVVCGSGYKAHTGLAIICCVFVAVSQYQYGYFGLAGLKLGYEFRPPQSRAVMARDYQAEVAGEVRLFDQAQSFRRIRYANHVTKALFERRHPYERLKRIVIN